MENKNRICISGGDDRDRSESFLFTEDKGTCGKR